MPNYKYKYIKESKEYEETKEFPDKNFLYKFVRENNGSILSVEELNGKNFFDIKFLSFGGRIKPQEVINLAKNLAVMIDAGMSISRALQVLGKQSQNKKLVEVLENIGSSINSGESLSKSLEIYPNIFSGLFISMVRAGEESGKLSYSLRVVADQLEKTHNLSKKVKGAMIYPTVIISVMVVIGVVLMVYMVPMLTETFKGLNITLPLPTRIVIAISDFLKTNVFATFGVLIAVFLGAFYGLKSKKGKNFADYVILHMPMIKNMSKEVNAARTARTLSSLISSGVGIVSAIGIASDVVQNHYFKNLLKGAAKKVETGELLSVSLSESNGNLYPIFVGEMLSVGEETGKIAEMLENVAAYYEEEVNQKTKDLSTVIEPFLMILIGIAVGIFAVAMMLPTYSLVDAIK